MVKLDIVSDPICPWCYIGKTFLDGALENRPDHPFAIEWHPFQLNPDMPAGGMDRKAYLERKFGGRQGAASAYAPVLEKAAEAGLAIDFAAIARTPSTLDAHRLLRWAGQQGAQEPVAAALFRAYFDEGRDIGDAEILAAAAEGAGMDGQAVRRLLGSDADAAEIRERDAAFRRMGVTGVPTFIVAGRHVVTGCQPTAFWLRVVDDIAAQIAKGAEAQPQPG